MSEHFVTLFDSLYLPQGLALHASLQRWSPGAHLWVVAMDEAATGILMSLDLANVHVIPLAAFETPELRAVKAGRTVAEYCWTITPFTPSAVFERDPSVDRITYLDADLWFARSPAPIFREFEASGARALITEHAYAPEYDASEASGIYCVQFMTFVRDDSQHILRRWQGQCLDWCFDRFEDGKFGDQKYLDSWPEEYGNAVHVLTRPEWSQAPWNSVRFPHSKAIFYHFHGLKVLSRSQVGLGLYRIPRPAQSTLYRPYLNDLAEALTRLQPFEESVSPRWLRQSRTRPLTTRLRYWRHQVRLLRSPTRMPID